MKSYLSHIYSFISNKDEETLRTMGFVLSDEISKLVNEAETCILNFLNKNRIKHFDHKLELAKIYEYESYQKTKLFNIFLKNESVI